MTTYYDPRDDLDRDIHNSLSSESSSSSQTANETREERAARIRQNQRRCRERKLAYISSLEERIRAYESNGVQANVQLQKLAKKLDAENKKLRKVCTETLGLSETDLERADTDVLVEEIKARLSLNASSAASGVGTPPSSAAPSVSRGWASRSSSFSGGIIDTSSFAWGGISPFSTLGYPSAPLSDVRSQKPPTPPPSKDDGPASRDPTQELLLTIAPNGDARGKRFGGLRLVAYEGPTGGLGKVVPCRVSYELLKNLIGEQGPENAFALKEGNGGYCVDTKVLSTVLEALATNVDMNSASSSMLLDM